MQTQLDSLTIMNNTHNHTHIPHQALYTPSSPDITFCSPCLTPTTSWRVVGTLGSDHLPIIITTKTRYTPVGHRHTYTNYKRANWEAFTEETEQHFETLNSTPITDINNAVHTFNTIIQNAEKRYILIEPTENHTTPTSHKKSKASSDNEMHLNTVPPHLSLKT